MLNGFGDCPVVSNPLAQRGQPSPGRGPGGWNFIRRGQGKTAPGEVPVAFREEQIRKCTLKFAQSPNPALPLEMQ